MSNGGQQQRSSYVESHAVAHAALQQHMAQQAAQARLTGPGLPAAPQPPNPTFTLPDDGLGYDDGVRVLRSIGTWCVRLLDDSSVMRFDCAEIAFSLEWFFLQTRYSNDSSLALVVLYD